MFQPSMSQEDMYKEMTTDLSNAAKVLPNEQGGGRFTKGAALTLKAWIDLYWGDIIKDPRPSSIFLLILRRHLTLIKLVLKHVRKLWD